MAGPEKTTDICKEGDTVKVKVIAFDDHVRKLLDEAG